MPGHSFVQSCHSLMPSCPVRLAIQRAVSETDQWLQSTTTNFPGGIIGLQFQRYITDRRTPNCQVSVLFVY
ncbi:hypothetical protein T4E_12350 [Trichinella pseudospiralis]|uniref:Uncharacterized protein n=1 Tax=Trichinella pseudospiralis TaxID=6337 RepID=A0A0V0Y5Z7_TRIPS|nr:hypothetical protein T4E_12350 [Trichinella pseudospiralis]